ncbi:MULTISPECIES: rhodanese-like domain-containing protein [Pontibacillus]|uniref:Rhodanese-like domain-containing protein n=1 Tax=Pontibacillus chungwhensis TaxID=265426 RepID=A0ABY8V7A4_9BACI|nr:MULTISPECIES: rhodanese-like domain-containing protein [Pontibacillus]MCD5322445.1 rhodanese-like domain-containing protein [Pontibacillus sp. HN14]WIF99731.1 rhodanese-like domain-containing protein [Pontibacillus chungwhensis]
MDTIITVLLIAVAVYFISKTIIPPKGVEQISPAQAQDKLKSKKKQSQFVDVRTPGEYNRNQIRGFTNLPLQSLKAQSSQLDQSKEVVLLCQSGTRSMAAARVLKKQGFTHITNIRGGLNAWK